MKLRILLFALIASACFGLLTHSAHAANGPLVYISSTSPAFTQAQVDATAHAYQIAVSRDMAPVWGTDATLTTDSAQAARADMSLVFQDDIDCWGCLGYHWTQDGKPIAYVGLNVSKEYADDARLVGAHELEEMLVDPYINHFARWAGRTWLVEVSDPCEAGSYAYWIEGVPISDFITPAWYGSVRGRRVDFTGGLRRPGQIGVHGYASFLDPSQASGWGQVFGFHAEDEGTPARHARVHG